ncbi:hypothetical protein GCM10009741_74950 [Kribbella lupini]|uniref:Uncharacterized protein n=1 Tax=Kribbella lupini TaxID=291602 RepID=A0ABN2CLV1_9ACTN
MRPPAYTATAAPSSGKSSKFRANASATGPNRSSAYPLGRMILILQVVTNPATVRFAALAHERISGAPVAECADQVTEWSVLDSLLMAT